MQNLAENTPIVYFVLFFPGIQQVHNLPKTNPPIVFPGFSGFLPGLSSLFWAFSVCQLPPPRQRYDLIVSAKVQKTHTHTQWVGSCWPGEAWNHARAYQRINGLLRALFGQIRKELCLDFVSRWLAWLTLTILDTLAQSPLSFQQARCHGAPSQKDGSFN